MPSAPADVKQTLENRLRMLERSNARMRRALLVLAAGAGLALFVGGAGSEPSGEPEAADASSNFEQLSVKRLELLDDQGRRRIECAMDAGMPVMRFYDENGVSRIRLLASTEWPTIEIFDHRGGSRLSLGNSPKGPGILFQSPEGHPRTVLGATEDGPGLVLFDARRPRVLVGVKNNQPVMAVLNSDSSLKFDRPLPAAEPPRPDPGPPPADEPEAP